VKTKALLGKRGGYKNGRDMWWLNSVLRKMRKKESVIMEIKNWYYTQN